jgi:hypothetical protein
VGARVVGDDPIDAELPVLEAAQQAASLWPRAAGVPQCGGHPAQSDISIRPAAALALLVLTASSRREERELTAWLKLEIVRPMTGTSGVVVLGSNEEAFRAKVGNRWETLGSGHPTRYLVLNDPNKESYDKDSQPVALLDLNNGQGLQVLRAGEDRLRSLQDVFGRTGDLSVPPDRTAIDFLDCRERAAPTGCRDLQIHRYGPTGTPVKTFHVRLRDTHPGCRILAVRGYDSVDTPYLDAQCSDSERAQCLLVAPLGRCMRPADPDVAYLTVTECLMLGGEVKLWSSCAGTGLKCTVRTTTGTHSTCITETEVR